LETVVRMAVPSPGMRVLDIGTGTANLAAFFAAQGCSLWGTDFSTVMLEAARRKLPQAQFVLADVRRGWPAELPPVFERIVSGYIFHHFELKEKIRILVELSDHLAPQGQLVMADIAFPDHTSQENVRQLVGDAWDDEYYWLADETIAALSKAGLKAAFSPVSFCAGVFLMEKQ
jgi:putative AdoMet-dependent methyltransferase